MKQKIVVLRARRNGTRDIFLGPRGPAAPMGDPGEGMEVEVQTIERRDIPKVARSGDVVALAPSMPMRLVAPVDIKDVAAQPAADEIAWGVKAVGADTSPFDGNGVVVAVLDTGIDASHPAFGGVTIVQKDFTGTGDGDAHGHGTHCAGTIFGRTTASQRIGVAPGVKKALIGKVLGPGGGSSESIVSAIQWAHENGAHVISMSLGMDFPGLVEELQGQGMPVALATSRALEAYRANVQLFERLAAWLRVSAAFIQPTVLVAAAGNESRREQHPDFELAVAPPAVSEGFISVGALGQASGGWVVGDFSNTGPNLSGPGVDILSAKAGGGFRLMSGTSMATPHVAGVAALWAQKISANGPLTPLNLTSKLVAAAVTEGLKAPFDPFDVGAGMVRAPQS